MDTINVKHHTFYAAEFQNIVEEAIDFFSKTPIYKLPPPDQFKGTGVYGLYYIGKFEFYKKISGQNRSSCFKPIYIGKAVPAGWRTARTTHRETMSLYKRLCEHKKSIEQAQNLDLNDFRCRFMILAGFECNLIGPIEAELIRKNKPMWNTVVDGFGNHDPGSGRYNQAKSEWDVLHPGRYWADRLTGVEPDLKSIIRKIEKI